MVYFKDSREWLHQSTLLLEARPTTTRITTKYTLLPLTPRPSRRHPAGHPAPSSSSKTPDPSTTKSSETPSSNPTPQQQSPQPQPQSSAPPPSRAYLDLKTYDPVSGTCLKYRTDKAAEVGRLIAALGRCGRAMAALPEENKGDEGRNANVEEVAVQGTKSKAPVPQVVATPGAKEKDGKGQAKSGGGGGGGKKKKGKR